MTTKVQEAAVIKKAIAILRKGRWIQANSADGKGGFCAVGAIWEAVDTGGEYVDGNLVIRAVERHAGLKVTRKETLRPLAAWNDAPGRKKKEVLALLATAAEAMAG